MSTEPAPFTIDEGSVAALAKLIACAITSADHPRTDKYDRNLAAAILEAIHAGTQRAAAEPFPETGERVCARAACGHPISAHSSGCALCQCPAFIDTVGEVVADEVSPNVDPSDYQPRLDELREAEAIAAPEPVWIDRETIGWNCPRTVREGSACGIKYVPASQVDEAERLLAEERAKHKAAMDCLADMLSAAQSEHAATRDELATTKRNHANVVDNVREALGAKGRESMVEASERVVRELHEAKRTLKDDAIRELEEERREHAATRKEYAKLRDEHGRLLSLVTDARKAMGAGEFENVHSAALRVVGHAEHLKNNLAALSEDRLAATVLADKLSRKYEFLRDSLAGVLQAQEGT